MATQKIRLDKLLVDRGIAPTLERARALILARAVKINDTYPDKAGAPVPVLFTAHSVPCRTIQTAPAGTPADPYAEDAKRTAALVAERVPEIPQWWFAFQSQGMSGGPWVGPTVESTLDAVAAAGVKALLLQPIGFLCDHVEILYDVDILFRGYAGKLGIRLERPESLNDSVTLAKAIAELARQGLVRLQN